MVEKNYSLDFVCEYGHEFLVIQRPLTPITLMVIISCSENDTISLIEKNQFKLKCRFSIFDPKL